jgi:hypothetical protein
MKRITVTVLAFIVTLGVGCAGKAPIIAPHPGTTDTLANAAYDLAIAAKAFTDKIKSQHPECATAAGVPGSSTLCVDLARAISAKDTLIDAAEIYCAGPNFNGGGSCDPPAPGTPALTQATAKLNAAMASYSAFESDLKGVL